VQKRTELTAARDQEDHDRDTRRQKNDEIFKMAHTVRRCRLDEGRSVYLELERSDLEASLQATRDRQAAQLETLRRQHAQEIAAQEVRIAETLEEIKTDTDAMVVDLIREQKDETKNRLDARQREDEELQQRRKEQDDRLKDELFQAADEESRRYVQPASPKAAAGQIVSNKRTNSIGMSPNQENLRSSKRQKIDESLHPAGYSSSNSSSALPPTFQTGPNASKAPAGVTNNVPEQPQNEGKKSALKTDFAIKFIENVSGPHPKTTWNASSEHNPKFLRANPAERIFEPYDGERCESVQCPGWVINNEEGSCIIWHDRSTARIHLITTGDPEQGQLRVEFTDVKEFDAFTLTFAAYYKGKFTDISHLVSLFSLFSNS